MQVSGTVLFYGQNHGRRRHLGAFEHSCQNAPSTFEEGVGGGRPADKSSAAAGLLQCHRLGAPPVVKQTEVGLMKPLPSRAGPHQLQRWRSRAYISCWR